MCGSSIFCKGKGQLISKDFLKKRIRLYYYDTSGRLVFVCFFGRNWRHQKDISKLKFMFSKKATKIDKIFPVDLTLCSKCQMDSEDFVNFCGLLGKYEL